TIARGRIKSITFDANYNWSPITIASSRDIPGHNYVALIENDQPLLAELEISHYDEPILLIAANTKSEVHEAARHIQIEYEELPPVLTIRQSLDVEAVLYSNDNIFKRFLIGRGDIDEGFAAADRIIEGEYRVPHQEQLYIEPQGMIAIPGDGEMTVMGS